MFEDGNCPSPGTLHSLHCSPVVRNYGSPPYYYPDLLFISSKVGAIYDTYLMEGETHKIIIIINNNNHHKQ
jgi:hypothetical protein